MTRACPISALPRRSTVGVLVLTGLLSATAAQAQGTTVTFRDGLSGYTGTRDTMLEEDPVNSGADNGPLEFSNWDSDNPVGTGFDVYALIHFEDVVGNGAGQVPPGSLVNSATLYLTVFNVGDTGQVKEVLGPWSESASFDSFCGTSCDEGMEHGPTVGTISAAASGEAAVDVTSTVQAWVNGSPDHGWIVRPSAVDGDNGVDFRSSEYSVAGERPRLVVTFGGSGDQFVREPYLQAATPFSMTVCWRMSGAVDGRVVFGTDPEVLDQEEVDEVLDADHCVPLTGLSPSTTYYYAVGTTSEQLAGPSPEYRFRTPPIIGSVEPFRAWAVGDGGTGTLAQVDVMNAMLGEAGSEPPEMALMLGDIAYEDGTDAEFTDNYFAPYSPVLRNTMAWPTLGNHEARSTTSDECWPPPCTGSSIGPYYEAFLLPTSGEWGGMPSGTEAYYSFDHGNVHFVSLNSSEVDRGPTAAMASWLDADLTTTAQEWIVAFWHHPPYSKGSHDSDTSTTLTEMRVNLLPILEDNGVDLVLTGHSHGYERSYLIDGTYATPTPPFQTLLANGNILDSGDGRVTGDGPYTKGPGLYPHDGTVYVVAGHGGRPLSPIGAHPVKIFTEQAFGSLLLDFDGQTLNVRNVREDGVVTDEFTIVKDEECTGDPECSDLDGECTVGVCDAGRCIPMPANEGGSCDDGIACTGVGSCSSGSCDPGPDDCPPGETCDPDTGVCEVPPEPGDVIVAGFQSWNTVGAQSPAEFVSLFNTTEQPIALDDLELHFYLDSDDDGDIDLDWQLANSGPDLSGAVIAPGRFFLIAESGVAAPGGDFHDLRIPLNLATTEGGNDERAISIELRIDGVTMDHVVYGRHDGSDTGADPPGDLPFDGVSYPRVEVIRNTDPLATSFREGVVRRLSPEDLYAGHAVEGYFTDEDALGQGFPPGVWTAAHSTSDDGYQARNSLSPSVPRPPCAIDTDMDGQIDCFDPDDDDDGVPDESDCAPLDPLTSTPPGEVSNLRLDGTTLLWGSAGSGMLYDCVGDSLAQLRADGDVADAECLADSIDETSVADPAGEPTAGQGLYYLVRARNSCAGVYGSSSSGAPRVPGPGDCVVP